MHFIGLQFEGFKPVTGKIAEACVVGKMVELRSVIGNVIGLTM